MISKVIDLTNKLKQVVGMSTGTYIASSFLYINLGCHMMFILKNRLQAQGIPSDKNTKILHELVSAIFKEEFIKTMLIPQEPLDINTLKDLFRKLAHSSIMKLDNSSMEKLLFLILMTLKKQTFLTSSPLELYPLTVGNMRILQKYVIGTPSEITLQSDIKIFSQTAGKYSFTQYLQLKEYILSLLEIYQTKVINFNQTGHQNHNGKLIYQRRNTHNQLPLGSAKRHPQLKISQPQGKTAVLPLQNWREWKTSLVIDHATEYQKQSERRRINGNWAGKEKSINQLFKLSADNVTDFEVKLDLFDYGASSKSSVTNKQQKAAATVAKQHRSKQSEIKGKIEQQFQSILLKEEQDLDLLEMMDN